LEDYKRFLSPFNFLKVYEGLGAAARQQQDEVSQSNKLNSLIKPTEAELTSIYDKIVDNEGNFFNYDLLKKLIFILEINLRVANGAG
jgi:hypothetical protein